MQSLLVDGKSISFQLYSSIEGLILDILSGWLLILSRFHAKVTAYWKHLKSLFFGFIVDFLSFSHFGESMYDPPLLMLILFKS